jgi:putative transposase
LREEGLLTLSERAWAKAKHRAAIIVPLASQQIVTRSEAETAAKRLGVSTRAVYKLIARCRSGDGLLTDLAPRTSSGGKGKPRIQVEVEGIVGDVIESFYLSRQRRSIAAIVREIRIRCVQLGYQAPARNTVEARIGKLDPKRVTYSREGYDATKRLNPVIGETPAAEAPLSIVQMDHSPVDVIVVDESSRQSIGRPTLTLAIDVFTRCIVGMLVTLEAPSATSVGLCLAHTVCKKEGYLLRLGLQDIEWPMFGKPKSIHTDNGREFHSEALERGCEQHGIKQDFRPKKQPHFGGIIERVIGTAMKMSHELPGTTFSNIRERGKYDSEGNAVLTLQELEKWLVLTVAGYHKNIHKTLKMPPASFWRKNVSLENIAFVRDEKAFLIDFLPVIKRRIGRTGFMIDHISYYADTLKPWIARRDKLGQFIIRRDPRDISCVWALDPLSNQYLELPYRCISNPSVTLWEHRKAVEILRKSGRAEVDEVAIFRMILKMRAIVDGAEKETKQARRDKARRSHLAQQIEHKNVAPAQIYRRAKAKPFDEIEEW